MRQFYASPILPHACAPAGNKPRGLSPQEIEEWGLKLKWIWKPQCFLEVRPRCGCAGPLFLAQLDCDLQLHAGVGRDGVDLCAVWRGNECVMWNNLVGFCSMWPPIPTREQADSFNAQMRPIIRRNCFLLGGRIEATQEERKEWIQWLAMHTNHR
jgi:hypothetical protein